MSCDALDVGAQYWLSAAFEFFSSYDFTDYPNSKPSKKMKIISGLYSGPLVEKQN
jgi:hypothetical protein